MVEEGWEGVSEPGESDVAGADAEGFGGELIGVGRDRLQGSRVAATLHSSQETKAR